MKYIKLSNRLPYNPKLKERARNLRKNMTKPEKKIWYEVFKPLQEIYGFRILRQRPILDFIVDFYIPKFMIVIEIDGDTHYTDEAIGYDEERTIELNKLGLDVIRYTNYEVLNNIDGVMEDLRKRLEI